MQISNSNNNLSALNTRLLSLASSMEKLSGGMRINRAGDDAAGLAISEKMRGQISGLDTASRNASDSVSLVQTAEGALGETHSIMQRMRELAVQSGNGIYSDSDRAMLQAEFGQLQAEIDRIGNSTEFNTKKLLDGSNDAESAGNAVTAQVGANGGQSLDISIREMRAGALGIADLDISTAAGASSALEALDAAIDQVSSQRGSLGAQQNRLEHTINNLNAASENQQAAESRIRDTDMAREIIRRTTDDILRQTSMAMIAQSSMARQNVLQLLGAG